MDLLNLAAEESVDQPDLLYAVNDVPIGVMRELTDGVLQAAGAASIFSGFIPAAAATSGPVTVGTSGVANRALLSASLNGQLVTGNLIATGDTQSIDISTYAAGTYGIYISFVRQPGAPESRSIWSGVDQAEYSQVVNTRLVAGWQVRIENPSPGAQWTQIGTATIASSGSGQGNTVTVVDQRPLFFEGTFDALYKPVWGTSTDRGLRRTATISTLRQMVDALKQCIVDIKGPNVARWYDPYITGLNVGPNFSSLTDTPGAARVAIGDGSFYLQGDPYLPTLAFAGGTDYLQLNRSTGDFLRYRNGSANFVIRQDGSALIASSSPLYPYANLSVQGAGYPRTAMVVTTSPAFGSMGVGSIVPGYGGYIALGDGSTLGGQARWGIYGATSGNGLFQLQCGSQGAFLECAPTATSGGNAFQTSLYGQNIRIFPASGGTTTFYNRMFFSNRQFVYGAMVFVCGTYVFNNDGNGNPGARFVGPDGVYCNSTNNNSGSRGYGATQEMTFSNVTLPTNPVVQVIPRNQAVNGGSNYRCVAPQINWQGSTLVVQFRNDNNEVVNADFDFVIFFGSG